MTLKSILRDRLVRWAVELAAYGYEPSSPGRTAEGSGEFALRARRPTHYGGPSATIDVRELWAHGADPDGLGLGCYLEISGWHAQLLSSGDVGALRLDVDRRKEPALVIHEHPLGQPNHVRVAAAPLVSPERWIHQVEAVILDLCEVDGVEWT